MAKVTSGKVLREARERKGYDLNTVARRLRIRPDILRAIEANDFSQMPPRGYTRNMVNAYARLLGLNPTEIVNMYLDEAYANQVKKARDTAPSSGFHMERETRKSRSRIGIGSGAVEDSVDEETGTTRYTRRLYDDGTRFSRDDYGVTRERTNKAGRSDRDFSSHHSGYGASSFNFLDEQSGMKRGNKGIYAGQTPMQYTPSRVPHFLQSRGVIIAIVAIVIVLIIAIVVIVTGGKHDNATEETTVPISGMSGQTGADSSAASEEPAPTSESVVYSVPQGETCYVITINDDKRTEEELTGPIEKKIDVTGTLVIGTFTPDYLKVTVDGQETKLTQSEKYDGMYIVEVNFADYLAKWRAAHPSREGQRQAAVAEAGITTPSSSSASASATDAANTGQTSDDSLYNTDNTTDYGYNANGTDYTYDSNSTNGANGYGSTNGTGYTG